MSGLATGYALTDSFCTFEKSVEQMRRLINEGRRLIPVMSETALSTDTRLGYAQDWDQKTEEFYDHEIWRAIVQVGPIRPKRLVDLILIAPYTGNILAKTAHGVTDTAVTMTVKSHLRVGGPVLLAISTNDALSAAAQNVGRLMSTEHIYFVPIAQNDPENKPDSVMSDFSLLPTAVLGVVQDKQMQPVLLQK